MKKSDIQNKCTALNLSCSFKTGSYTEKTAKDIAISQSKNANTTVSEGTNLTITLSAGIIQKVSVPNLVGKTKSQIESQCKSLGIVCKFTYSSSYSDKTKDTCLSQSKTGTVNQGSTITFTLSKGPAKTYSFGIQNDQCTWGNPQKTKSDIEALLKKACPGVTFKYSYQKPTAENQCKIGYFVKNSDIQVGSNKVTQGKTYNVIICSN